MARSVTVNCPHCNRPATYEVTIQNGSQSQSCKHCVRSFTIVVANGQFKGVRK
jgi:transposase-like protein